MTQKADEKFNETLIGKVNRAQPPLSWRLCYISGLLLYAKIIFGASVSKPHTSGFNAAFSVVWTCMYVWTWCRASSLNLRSIFHLGFHTRRAHAYSTAHAGHPASNISHRQSLNANRQKQQQSCRVRTFAGEARRNTSSVACARVVVLHV